MTINEIKQMIMQGSFVCVIPKKLGIMKLYGTAKNFYKYLEPKIGSSEPKNIITTSGLFFDEIIKPELSKAPLGGLGIEFSVNYKVDLWGEEEPISEIHSYAPTAVFFNTQTNQSRQKIKLKVEIPKEKIKVIESTELQDDALKTILKNKAEFIDIYGGVLIAQLWKLGINDLKITEEERKSALEILFLMDKTKNETDPFIPIIFYALTHRKSRYSAKHDAMKLLVQTRSKKEKVKDVQILENGFVRTRLYLSEKHKKNLDYYHLTALFDLLNRLIKMGKIKDKFIVFKSNVTIDLDGNQKDLAIITNQTIRDFLDVNDYEASQIKKAIYELTELVLIGEQADGTTIGIYPIRKVGFIENKKKKVRFDVFEIDSVLLRNGKRYIPMLPESFSKILKFKLPGKQKQFINDVYLYLLETRNFKSGDSYLSAKSFSKKFPNAYSKQRRWKMLDQKIEEALEILCQNHLIEDYTREKGHWIVRLRN